MLFSPMLVTSWRSADNEQWDFQEPSAQGVGEVGEDDFGCVRYAGLNQKGKLDQWRSLLIRKGQGYTRMLRIMPMPISSITSMAKEQIDFTNIEFQVCEIQLSFLLYNAMPCQDF